MATKMIETVRNERCEHCGKAFHTMVGMEPGSDNKIWFLCVTCWAEGLKKKSDDEGQAA